MILSKEQINRYLRHIIIPEISGQGQKKLLEFSVLVYGETVEEISPMIYYLAATGIGNIICNLHNVQGVESLISNIKDYNPDICLKLNNENENNDEVKFRIFFGNINYITNFKKTLSVKNNIFIPSIISVYNQWNSIITYFDNDISLNHFITNLSNEYTTLNNINKDNCSNIISYSILGTLCAIECFKRCLQIGQIQNDNLYLDLFSMEFNNIEQNNLPSFIKKLCAVNYDNINNNYIKEVMSKSKVLIVGAGGLGAPAAYNLALAGVGTIGLIDNDKVELSNLNRQIIHSVSRIGMPKVESAKIFLKNINLDLNVKTYMDYLNLENITEIINDYDIVISAVDNIQTRYLLNDACIFANKPLVEAGVLKFNGTNTTIIPNEGHCYRCLFPNLGAGSGASCSETGVLGPVPGIMGFIQSAEVIKIIAKIGITLKNKILMFDAIDFDFMIVNLERNPNCPVCGKNPSITTLQIYDFTCKTKEDI